MRQPLLFSRHSLGIPTPFLRRHCDGDEGAGSNPFAHTTGFTPLLAKRLPLHFSSLSAGSLQTEDDGSKRIADFIALSGGELCNKLITL